MNSMAKAGGLTHADLWPLVDFNSGKVGAIDRNGHWIIEPKFEKIFGFHADGKSSAVYNGRCGILWSDGRWTAAPADVSSISLQLEGPHVACSGRKYGFLDDECNWLLRPALEHALGFRNGLCVATKDGLQGALDREFQWQIAPRFKNLGVSHSSMALARLPHGVHGSQGLYGYVDLSGEWVIGPKYFQAFHFSSEAPELASAQVILDGLGARMGLIDRYGGWHLEPRFSWIGSLSNGRSFAREFPQDTEFDDESGKTGVIDLAGNWIIDPNYLSLRPFEEGFSAAETDEGYGLIDEQGAWRLKPVFDFARSPHDGLIEARMEAGRTGLLDLSLNWVLPPLFDEVRQVGELILTTDFDRQGYWDRHGQPIAGFAHRYNPRLIASAIQSAGERLAEHVVR